MPGIEKQSDEVKNLLESPGSREGACEWPLVPSGHPSIHLALCHITGEGQHRMFTGLWCPPSRTVSSGPKSSPVSWEMPPVPPEQLQVRC